METCHFPEDTKVRRFCLTLTGEARLWYESTRPIEMDWDALQEHFRQQYSKFGSSREQYFQVWSAMTLVLDILYGYHADVIGTIYYYLDMNTFGMVPTWYYDILRGYCNCYLILMCKCL